MDVQNLFEHIKFISEEAAHILRGKSEAGYVVERLLVRCCVLATLLKRRLYLFGKCSAVNMHKRSPLLRGT